MTVLIRRDPQSVAVFGQNKRHPHDLSAEADVPRLAVDAFAVFGQDPLDGQLFLFQPVEIIPCPYLISGFDPPWHQAGLSEQFPPVLSEKPDRTAPLIDLYFELSGGKLCKRFSCAGSPCRGSIRYTVPVS